VSALLLLPPSSMLRISGVPSTPEVIVIDVAVVACGVVKTPSPPNEAYRKLSAPLDPTPVERTPAARNTSDALPPRTSWNVRPVSVLRYTPPLRPLTAK